MPSLFYCDDYTLATMGQYYYENSDNDLVSFEMPIKSLPPNRGYLVTAGLGTALWWLEHIEFGEREWQYMIDHGFDHAYVTWLYEKARQPRFFTGDVYAIPEGTPIGPNTPYVRVTAPRIEATLIESMLLSSNNHQVMVASKAARIVHAADQAPVWDFSLRRLHGADASIGVARAAYIAGCAGTATVEAGALLGIPVTGTMAHSFMQMRGPLFEIESFVELLQRFPDRHALLPDTFEMRRGIANAIKASQIANVPLRAIRLDSGDLLHWSRYTRQELNSQGMYDTQIVASNDLDEYSISELFDEGAPINAYGVGTRLGTVPDAPNVGGTYKLVEQHERCHADRYVMKFSEEKSTNPGCHQVWRSYDYRGERPPDIISLADEDFSERGYRPLMVKVMENGRKLRQPSLEDSRTVLRKELLHLTDEELALTDPTLIRVEISDKLRALKERLTIAAEAA